MKKITLLFLCFLIIKANGQINNFQTITPGGLFDSVYDNEGNAYHLSTISLKPNINNSLKKSYSSYTCSGSYYELFFDDDWYNGGDSAYIDSAKMVICQVLKDISNFMPSPLTSNGNKIAIWVRNITSVNNSPNALGVASGFYILPNAVNANYSGGVFENALWKSIHTGKNAFADIVPSLQSSSITLDGTTYFHGYLALNFAGAFSWNYKLNALPLRIDSIGSGKGELDLYTVVLHEISHALGFHSIISKDKLSKFTKNQFTYYDKFLRSYKDSALLVNSGNISLYNYKYNNSSQIINHNNCNGNNSSGNNTICDSAVKYTSSFSQKVYTPSCFENGSSLSHFEDLCLPPGIICSQPNGLGNCNDRYFLMSNALNDGYANRSLKPNERTVLCDIGYKTNTTFGNNATLNFVNYGSACNGNKVVGQNDGLVNTAFIYNGFAGTPITIQDTIISNTKNFMFNDINANKFEGLEVIYGSGIISKTFGNNKTKITYTPDSNRSTIHLLRYVPFDSISNQRGNITYIYVWAKSTKCPTINACSNFINNNGFENNIGCNEIDNSSSVYCWEKYSGTPDLIKRNCTVPIGGVFLCDLGKNTWNNIPPVNNYNAIDTSTKNDGVLGLLAVNTGIQLWAEAIQTTLKQPLVKENYYSLSFWARVNNRSISELTSNPFTYVPSSLIFCSDTIPRGAIAYTDYPASNLHKMPNCSFFIPNDNQWHRFDTIFKHDTDNHNQLFIGSSFSNLTENHSYTYIDDVDLRHLGSKVSLSIPSSICIGDSFEYQISIPISNVNYFVDGVLQTANNNGKYFYKPSTKGLHIIKATFNVNGCKDSILASVFVNGNFEILGVSSICVGQTQTFGNQIMNGIWSTSDTNLITINQVGKAFAKMNGNATIIYKYFDSCINNFRIVTKNLTIKPLPLIDTIKSQGGFTKCIGDSFFFSCNPQGGIWYSTFTAIYSTNFSNPKNNIFKSYRFGNDKIYYSYTDSNNCTSTINRVINVDSVPVINKINVFDTICGLNTNTQFLCNPLGGVWSLQNINVASITTSGMLVSNAYGKDTLTYFYQLAGSCKAVAKFPITIIAKPTITSIAPSQSTIIVGNTTSIIATIQGSATQVWTSSNTTVATVNNNGVVIAIGVGVATIKLIATNSSGCKDSATVVITVIALCTPQPPNIQTTNPTICQNTKDSLRYYVNVSGGNTLLWWGADTSINGSNIAPFLNTSITGIQTFYVAQKNASGCISSKVKITITIRPKPSIIPLPGGYNITFCKDESVTFTIKNALNFISYSWYDANDNKLSADSTITLNINLANPNSRAIYLTAIDSFGCFDSTKQPRMVNVQPCYSTCSLSEPPLALSTAFTAGGTSNRRMKCNDYETITIAPTKSVTFNKCELIMGKNSKIIVPYGTQLNLNGCHIYSCDSLWQGIDVAVGGQLTLQKSEAYDCFIEDAMNAIQIVSNIISNPNYNTVNNANTYLLKVSNTIFNRNNTGINFNVSDPMQINQSLISLSNSIFTCRHISFTSGSAWTTVAALKQSSSCSAVPVSYNSPFMANSPFSTSNYGSFLKIANNYTLKSAVGINVPRRLLQTGILLIGDSNNVCNKLIFDNLGIGINNNSNAIRVRNCVFQNALIKDSTLNTTLRGMGIYATNCDSANRIDISGAVPQNVFYNNKFGIRTSLCTNVNIATCIFSSSQSITDTTKQQGKWGIFTQGQSYNNINLTNCSFFNIANGIKVDVSAPIVTTGKQTKAINISNNYFSDTVPNSICSNCYIQNGITLTGGPALSANKEVKININSNQLFNVFNGISVSNNGKKDHLIDNNFIKLKTIAPNSSIRQYGIEFKGVKAATSLKNIISNDSIIGSCNTCNQIGVYVTSSDNAFVSCNAAENLTHGFMFEGSRNLASKFWDNKMKPTNFNGLTLYNNGVITNLGVGASGRNPNACTSDNSWVSDSNAWKALNHNTVLCWQGTNAANSQMFIRQQPPYTPEGATANGGATSTKYTVTNGINYVLPNKIGTCNHCGVNVQGFIAPLNNLDDEIPTIELLEEIALEDPTNEPTPQEQDEAFAAQQALFDFLQSNPSLLQYSQILQDFMLDNKFGTLDYRSLTDYAIANNLYNFANVLLSTWQPIATPDNNYFNYYNWQLKNATDSTFIIPIDSVLAIANQCHITGGDAVFAARNLYNYLTEEDICFDIECNVSGSLGRLKKTIKTQSNKVDKIEIYPNPTNGYVFINLPTIEKPCWKITITNMYGKVLQEKTIRNKTNKTFIELIGSRGMYLINVLNCKTNKQETQKIILQ